jgi:hypothetical protein
MSEIRKRGNVWFIRYYSDGKRVERSLGTHDEKVAKVFQKGYDQSLETNEEVVYSPRLALGSWVQSWLKEKCPHSSPRQAKAYESYARKLQTEDQNLWEKPIGQIKTLDLLNYLTTTGGDYSPKHKQRLLLSLVFKFVLKKV